jgi:hypothetical protein
MTDAPIVDVEKLVTDFIELRDKLDEFDKKTAVERKKIADLKDSVLGEIGAFMSANNLENLRTKAGTASRKIKYTATVADAELFMELVKAGNYDLIERRANSTAVQQWVRDHNELPAGVNLSQVESVGVQRPAKKTKEPLTTSTILCRLDQENMLND